MVPGCLYIYVCECGWWGHGACSCQILVSVSLSVEKFTYIFATSFSKFATTITTLQPPCYCYSVLVIICNNICTSTGSEVKTAVKWPSEHSPRVTKCPPCGCVWPLLPPHPPCDGHTSYLRCSQSALRPGPPSVFLLSVNRLRSVASHQGRQTHRGSHGKIQKHNGQVWKGQIRK